MRRTGIGVLVSVTILSGAIFSIEPTCAAGSRAFCGTWLSVCNRTCPGGAGTCGGVCGARHAACLTSGCFYFNTPGPRCEGNAKDQAATTRSRDRMQKDLPVGCGPRFGRPCD
jgi:hypothetical protein